MTKSTSRREFLRYAAKLSALGTAAPIGLNLATINAAAAQQASGNTDDYRALVCVFLYGGNDAYNSIVPYDNSSYARYNNARQGVAVSRNDLSSTIITPQGGWPDGRQVALHPELAPLKTLFDRDQLALAMNVGTLNQPTSKRQFTLEENLPAKLMSHNDQFSLWQTLATEGASSGWGGRMGDLLAASNRPNDLFTNISVANSATFSAGNTSVEFMVGEGGVVRITPSPIVSNSTEIIDRVLARNSRHFLDKEVSRRYQQARDGSELIDNALSGVPRPDLGESSLAQQLATVSQLISANQSLGLKRQVFFVSMGGFDSHGSLATTHPVLLRELSNAMIGFQDSLDGISMGSNVTTFTASDFGRSLTTNGSGSDHGWGGHQFIMGGAVKGSSYVGELPSVELGADDDVGQGRLLPSIAVDQLAATLALWMGVSSSDLPTIIPNIGNYNIQDLGIFS